MFVLDTDHITIANRMMLLTRNTVDFERIPNLVCVMLGCLLHAKPRTAARRYDKIVV